MPYLQKTTALRVVDDAKPQLFFPVPGFPNHEISISGIVRNRKTGRALKTTVGKSAVRYYVMCSVGRIHRLLLAALLGRELLRTELVQHRDGNTFNNSPSNLEVGTAKSNALDKIAHNTNGKRLRNAQVHEIRRLAGRRTRKQIAAEFDISASHVSAIISRRRWGNLP